MPTSSSDSPSRVLPGDPNALLVGRLYEHGTGHHLVIVRDDVLVDITPLGPTMSDLLERTDLLTALAETRTGRSWPLEQILADTLDRRGGSATLLSPIDLQVIKAAGVTFATSMIERVIEERAKGDPAAAEEVRRRVVDVIGGAISDIVPGSAKADEVKRVLIADGLWSQYLEVGIGPDPEIFTKAPVLSSVGVGAEIGVLSRSSWNNPEPEVVLVVTAAGRIVGVTLGNDVNLRDFEGRSALLLAEAKDNNASCAIGPLIRLLDDSFTLDDVRSLEVDVIVDGDDGFQLHETSSLSKMSRDIEDLVLHTVGAHHQYPDGFVLFTGTLFAPTQDRDGVGLGFTHHRGDVVRISSPQLGALENRVTSSEDAADWVVGIRSLMNE
ncbi:MAG TPA: fumarylacetoacetate hydrolase family protein, partial [Galbitalea sp.]